MGRGSRRSTCALRRSCRSATERFEPKLQRASASPTSSAHNPSGWIEQWGVRKRTSSSRTIITPRTLPTLSTKPGQVAVVVVAQREEVDLALRRLACAASHRETRAGTRISFEQTEPANLVAPLTSSWGSSCRLRRVNSSWVSPSTIDEPVRATCAPGPDLQTLGHAEPPSRAPRASASRHAPCEITTLLTEPMAACVVTWPMTSRARRSPWCPCFCTVRRTWSQPSGIGDHVGRGACRRCAWACSRGTAWPSGCPRSSCT